MVVITPNFCEKKIPRFFQEHFFVWLVDLVWLLLVILSYYILIFMESYGKTGWAQVKASWASHIFRLTGKGQRWLWRLTGIHSEHRISILKSEKKLQINWPFIGTKRKNFHRHILENLWMGNFLTRFSTLAQHFRNNIFIWKDASFHALQHIKNLF